MKDLETGFAEIERRVRGLLKENAGLRRRVEELERELAAASSESEAVRSFSSTRTLLREKVEKVLRSLESLGDEGG